MSRPIHTTGTAHHTVGSSHGELTVDAEGYVTECRADNDDADGGRHLESITRFNLEEWRRYWESPATTRIDILDLGYWYTDSRTHNTAYAPPDAQWRTEIAEILLQRRKASGAHAHALSEAYAP